MTVNWSTIKEFRRKKTLDKTLGYNFDNFKNINNVDTTRKPKIIEMQKLFSACAIFSPP